MKYLFTKQSFIIVFFFVFFVGAIIVWNQKIVHLSSSDECVYTEYANEMRQAHDLFTYRWNKQIILEKPPLQGLLILTSFKLFGIGELQARLPSIILGLSAILVVYLLAYYLFNQWIATLSALILLSSHAFLFATAMVNTDIAFTFLILLGSGCWFISLKKRSYSYLTGIFFGFAELCKGMSVLIFFFAVLFTSIIIIKKSRLTDYAKAISMFILTILPWHLYELITYRGKFIQTYFIENLLTRSLHNIFNSHTTFLFYLELLFKDFFPWSFLVIIFLLYSLIFQRKKYYSGKNFFFRDGMMYESIKVLLTSVIFILMFFSSVSSRNANYILPLYPFLALSLGIYIHSILAQTNRRKVTAVIIILLMVNSMVTLFTVVRTLKLHEKSFYDRYELYTILKERSSPEIEYLVEPDFRDFWERNKNIHFNAIFTYGREPCMVYFTGKKVNYYYSLEEFKRNIRINHSIFVFSTAEMSKLPLESTNKLFKNDQFSAVYR